MSGTVFTVSELNGRVKSLLEGDKVLEQVAVKGELSNYKIYPSGHHYFTLKDADGALRCVMFKSSAVRLRFRPENGMKVVAYGRVTVYLRDGAYQLNCTGLTPEGVGDLYVAYEQLKEKLLKEGLFDKAHKKPLPAFPQRIALITSGAGAAVRDMIRILGKRWPSAKVIVMPVRVQGIEAPPEIVGAIRYANRYRVADLLITGRGGGSIEDLWAFNDERVARAIYESELPVISAVGHEPDVTIADFVADLRAATPSNAAELAVADRAKVYETLGSMQSRVSAAMLHRLDYARERLGALAGSRELKIPTACINDRRLLLDRQAERLQSVSAARLGRERSRFAALAAGLDAMSPLKVLARGYAVAEREGKVLKSVKTVKTGEAVDLRLTDGVLACEVKEVRVDGRYEL